MVILHVFAPGRFGGLERVVQSLAVGHRRRGHEVTALAVLDADTAPLPLLDSLEADGIELISMPLPPRRYFRERAALRGVCRELHPDLVHTHGYRCDVVDAGVARRLGLPTVTTVHGFTGGGPKNRFYEWLQQRAYRRFRAVVAVSEPQVTRLVRAGVPRSRIHLLRNAWGGREDGVDCATARRFLGLADGKFHVGWVGRVSHEKGLDVLLDALAHLEDLPLALTVIGDGRERPELQKRVSCSSRRRMVRWAGRVDDAGRYFSAFDVFALSSRTEGTPMVLFEAMEAGTPIVATHVGGVPDVISDAEALLVPSETPRALAEGIRAVYGHRKDARQRAGAARRRLEAQFASEPWLARYEEIYQRVTEPHVAGSVS